MIYRVAAVVISDRASRDEKADGCLPVFAQCLGKTNLRLEESRIVSDDSDEIRAVLKDLIRLDFHLVFTAGGTGCGPRDNTPEATRSFIEKYTTGIDEAIRSFSMKHSPYAIFSRGVSGYAGKTLIINLPGSPKAVGEILEFLLPIIEHPLKLSTGEIRDCRQEARDYD